MRMAIMMECERCGKEGGPATDGDVQRSVGRSGFWVGYDCGRCGHRNEMRIELAFTAYPPEVGEGAAVGEKS